MCSSCCRLGTTSSPSNVAGGAFLITVAGCVRPRRSSYVAPKRSQVLLPGSVFLYIANITARSTVAWENPFPKIGGRPAASRRILENFTFQPLTPLSLTVEVRASLHLFARTPFSTVHPRRSFAIKVLQGRMKVCPNCWAQDV